jgi:hypothetical protein
VPAVALAPAMQAQDQFTVFRAGDFGEDTAVFRFNPNIFHNSLIFPETPSFRENKNPFRSETKGVPRYHSDLMALAC